MLNSGLESINGDASEEESIVISQMRVADSPEASRLRQDAHSNSANSAADNAPPRIVLSASRLSDQQQLVAQQQQVGHNEEEEEEEKKEDYRRDNHQNPYFSYRDEFQNVRAVAQVPVIDQNLHLPHAQDQPAPQPVFYGNISRISEVSNEHSLHYIPPPKDSVLRVQSSQQQQHHQQQQQQQEHFVRSMLDRPQGPDSVDQARNGEGSYARSVNCGLRADEDRNLHLSNSALLRINAIKDHYAQVDRDNRVAVSQSVLNDAAAQERLQNGDLQNGNNISDSLRQFQQQQQQQQQQEQERQHDEYQPRDEDVQQQIDHYQMREQEIQRQRQDRRGARNIASLRASLKIVLLMALCVAVTATAYKLTKDYIHELIDAVSREYDEQLMDAYMVVSVKEKHILYLHAQLDAQQYGQYVANARLLAHAQEPFSYYQNVPAQRKDSTRTESDSPTTSISVVTTLEQENIALRERIDALERELRNQTAAHRHLEDVCKASARRAMEQIEQM